MTSLLGQIRKSRLFEWLIAYMAFAWLAAQFVSVIAEVWDLSIVFQRRAHVVLAFGVPATAILAWFHGGKGEQRFSRGELFVLAALFGVAAIAVPSVGTAGTTIVFGIPSSVVVPCSLVTMIIIPVWLISLSVYREQQRDGKGDAESATCPSEETLNELWGKLVRAPTQRQTEDVSEQVACLLTQHPDSQELKALQIAAERTAQHIATDQDYNPLRGVIATLEGSDEDSSIPDSCRPVIEIPDYVATRFAKKDRIAGLITDTLASDDATPSSESPSLAHRMRSVLRQIGKELKQRNVTRAVMIYAVLIFGAFYATNATVYHAAAPSGLRLAPVVSVAVLPFASESDDPNSVQMAAALAEGIRVSVEHDLSAGRLGVMTIDGFNRETTMDRTTAERLGLDYVVDGSVRLEEGRVSVAARLVDIEDDTAVWSESLEGDVNDIRTVSGQAAGKLADILEEIAADSSTATDYVNLMSVAAIFVVLGFSVLVVLFWFHGHKKPIQSEIKSR